MEGQGGQSRASTATPRPLCPSHGLPCAQHFGGIITPMAPQTETNIRNEELLADVITRVIGDVRHIAVGNASPIPAMAALLARARGGGMPYVSLLQSPKHNFFTDGGRELFDCAGQGRGDVFFLSGGEIDGARHVNLVSMGDYGEP